jgi:hypothetical protein
MMMVITGAAGQQRARLATGIALTGSSSSIAPGAG